MHNLLGIYEKALPGLSWEERYTLAENAGYDFIELSIDKKRLKERMGELDRPSMTQVNNALSISFGLGARAAAY